MSKHRSLMHPSSCYCTSYRGVPMPSQMGKLVMVSMVGPVSLHAELKGLGRSDILHQDVPSCTSPKCALRPVPALLCPQLTGQARVR